MVAAVAHVARRRLQDKRLKKLRAVLDANLSTLSIAHSHASSVKEASFLSGQASGLWAAILFVDRLMREEAEEIEEELCARRTGEVARAGCRSATSAELHKEAAGTPPADGAAGGWLERCKAAIVFAAFTALVAIAYLLQVGE